MTEAERTVYARVAGFLRSISRDPRMDPDVAEIAARESDLYYNRLETAELQEVDSLADTTADIG